MKNKFSLSFELKRIREMASGGSFQVKDLLVALGEHGPLFLILILCIPFLFPIPLPGLSTPFGLMIVFLGISVMLGRPPWMPRRFLQLNLPVAVILNACDKAEPLFRWFDRWLKPCWLMLTATRFGLVLHGLSIALAGVILSLPLPPGGNLIPALSLITFVLALLQRDGRLTLLGLLILVATFYFVSEVTKLLISASASFFH